MIVARPINQSEPDLLVGLEFEPLIIKNLKGAVMGRINPPESGWNHDSLELTEDEIYKISPFGWDLYLGVGGWIGGSEV